MTISPAAKEITKLIADAVESMEDRNAGKTCQPSPAQTRTESRKILEELIQDILDKHSK
jgi:hypothetical protein